MICKIAREITSGNPGNVLIRVWKGYETEILDFNAGAAVEIKSGMTSLEQVPQQRDF
jgi:hypothetical protein